MNSNDTLRDLSLLAARTVLGGSIASHGAQKMFGAFNGTGIEGSAQFLGSLGFQPAERYARMTACAELTLGTLIALGALGPVGPAMLLSVMITAIETVHRPKGYFNDKGGFEMNTMYILVAMLLATEGYGSLSFDALVGLDEKTNSSLGWLGLLGGVTAALLILGQRTPPQPPAKQEQGSVESGAVSAGVS